MLATAAAETLVACFTQDIAAILASFSEKDPASKQSLQQMLTGDPGAFGCAAVKALAGEVPPAGARYLVHLLFRHKLLMEPLSNPGLSSLPEASATAKCLAAIGTPLDQELERVLAAALRLPAGAAAAQRILRALELLWVIGAQRSCALFQSELMAYPQREVRVRSALLSARSSKSTALVGRMLLDEDAAVQAAAVEALASFEAADALPLLTTASKSKNREVAGKALAELYRRGELGSIHAMFDMAGSAEPAVREAGIRAMGETADPRFVPRLTALFSECTGNGRCAALHSLSSIRRRERERAQAEPLQIHVVSAAADAGGTRRVLLSLWSAADSGLESIPATQFAFEEGGAPVLDYTVAPVPNPALLIAAFIQPRFSSDAVNECIRQILECRRPTDLWRIDRYLSEIPQAAAPVSGGPLLPYDDVLLAGHKTLRGFLAAGELLEQIRLSPGSRKHAAQDLTAALERVTDAMRRISGTRHLFVFLAPGWQGDADSAARAAAFIRSEAAVPHFFEPPGFEQGAVFRELAGDVEGASYLEASDDHLPAHGAHIYRSLLNRYQATYRPDAAGTTGAVRIFSAHGCGHAEFSVPFQPSSRS